MKPKPTMTEAEVDAWKAAQSKRDVADFLSGSKLVDKQAGMKRSRLWAVEDLRKRSQGYGTPSQRAVILAFLDWLEAKGGPA